MLFILASASHCSRDCEDPCLLLALQQGCEDSLQPQSPSVGLVCGKCWVWSCTKHSGCSKQLFFAVQWIWGQTCWSWIVTWQKMSKWLCPTMRTWRDQQALMSTYLTSNTRWVEEKMSWGVLKNTFGGRGWAGNSVCAWCPKPKGRIHLDKKPKQKTTPN